MVTTGISTREEHDLGSVGTRTKIKAPQEHQNTRILK